MEGLGQSPQKLDIHTPSAADKRTLSPPSTSKETLNLSVNPPIHCPEVGWVGQGMCPPFPARGFATDCECQWCVLDRWLSTNTQLRPVYLHVPVDACWARTVGRARWTAHVDETETGLQRWTPAQDPQDCSQETHQTQAIDGQPSSLQPVLG